MRMRWLLTRGWLWLWAVGLAVVAWRALPPFPGDAFGSDSPYLTHVFFALAAACMFASAVQTHSWRLRLLAVGVTVTAMALRVSSLALVSDRRLAPDTRIVGIASWTMLAIATVLLGVLSSGVLGAAREHR